ncbi:MAG: histidine phosphatase family protein [Holophagaceae bacterium]|nr:histidine phosphatase family protein [Holophagaceae bacterium]
MLKALCLSLLLCAGLLAQDTVVVLLRHAEKSHKGDSALLSHTGQRRAASLPPQLGPYAPSALFASNLRRTQQTLEPLSKALALPLQIYERGREGALAQRILTLHSGQVVIVCGHSDTLMVLVSALGHGESFPEISGFDRYWVLRIDAGSGKVTLQEHQQEPLGDREAGPLQRAKG